MPHFLVSPVRRRLTDSIFASELRELKQIILRQAQDERIKFRSRWW